MKTWKIHKIISSKNPSQRINAIIQTLYKQRGLSTSKQINEFISPLKPQDLTLKQVSLKPTQLKKAIKLTQSAIKSQQPIIVYGDYDADGICATAVLWETLHKLKAKAIPFIPHRQKHGYGISKKGIDQIIKDNQFSATQQPLIITVDNGIVAHQAVKYAQKQGFKVIISDHHVASSKLPPAQAIVHSTKLAGAGVAWILSREITKSLSAISHKPYASSLELAAIGTVADMVPLLAANRCIVKHGLKKLSQTSRVGLLELIKEAGIESKSISSYEINFIIAPRLNAMGRLGHALDSLRLICTKNRNRASNLASQLSLTNRDRQELTENQLSHAKKIVKQTYIKQNILIVKSRDYHEGIIGLIAGRLVETYFRPSIVLSQGKTTSKASARSIPGFNIINALRQVKDLLVDVGGHPMAAGFTVENNKIDLLTQKLQQIAAQKINQDLLKKTLNIDCRINLTDVSQALFNKLKQFEPFGINNPRPVFSTPKVEVFSSRAVGKDRKHLKISVKQDNKIIPGIGFKLGDYANKLSTGDKINLAYQIDQNHWNGKKELQLKIKDIKTK